MLPAQPEDKNAWFTPSLFIEAARAVMGSIDLDPASCEEANQIVKATRYYTREDNGLTLPWQAHSLWLNPPYGRINGKRSGVQSWQGAFIEKLLVEWQMGRVEQAILLLLGNAMFKQWFPLSLWQHPICFHPTSIAFMRPGRGAHDTDRLGFGSLFVYLGPNEDRFIDIFRPFGGIVRAIEGGRGG